MSIHFLFIFLKQYFSHKFLLFINEHAKLFPLLSYFLTVSANEGQSPEGFNMAMGGATRPDACPSACWPPWWCSWPPTTGRPQGEGVLCQVVQYVLLALLLGAGTTGTIHSLKLYSLLFENVDLSLYFCDMHTNPVIFCSSSLLPSHSWSWIARWCSVTTRERLTWTNHRLLILEGRVMMTKVQRGRTRILSLSTWRRSFTAMESRWNGWWYTASSTTGRTLLMSDMEFINKNLF